MASSISFGASLLDTANHLNLSGFMFTVPGSIEGFLKSRRACFSTAVEHEDMKMYLRHFRHGNDAGTGIRMTKNSQQINFLGVWIFGLVGLFDKMKP